MAEIIWGGEPANDAERAVILHLRDNAPDSWKVVHNIELGSGHQAREIDVIVLTSISVCFLDTKGTRGRITVSGQKWHPERRQHFHSPLPKVRDQARKFASELQRAGLPRLREVYVDAAIVFPFSDTELVDQSGNDLSDTVHLDRLISFLKDQARIPPDRRTNVSALHADVLRKLRAVGHARTARRTCGRYQIIEELGGTDEVIDYRARQDGGREVLLRAYRADPYQPAPTRTAIRHRLRIAYDELCQLTPHPNVITALEFFEEEDESRFYLVTDARAAGSLRRRFGPTGVLIPDELRPRILADIVAGLAHCHQHSVAHRALTPDAILLASDGTALLTNFDYARGPHPHHRTVVTDILDVVDPAYLAPECRTEHGEFTTRSDCYAAAAIGYELFVGAPPTGPGTWVDELIEAGAPTRVAQVIARLAAADPQRRLGAAEAKRELTAQVSESTLMRDAEPADYRRLEPGYRLTSKYVIRERLGSGSYGTAYRVYDELEDRDKVVKIIDIAREVAKQPLLRELRLLQEVPPHPQVIRVLTADYLPDGCTPYLSLEYREGISGRELVEQRFLGPHEVLAVAHDLVAGLVHLHGLPNPIYHCDIKPDNMLHTDQGAVLIDFNVAVRAGVDESDGGATCRYLAPDFAKARRPTEEDYVHRDLFALGITLFELLTGTYPWDGPQPSTETGPYDPRQLTGYHDLAPEFADLLLRLIDGRQSRFTSAREVAEALRSLPGARRPVEPQLAADPANGVTTNQFVSHLKTLYSQSTTTNRGTRGLDPPSFDLYVETALDRALRDDILTGKHRLIVITGNAGDGKTAFLERLIDRALNHHNATNLSRGSNGSKFSLKGRLFQTNLDGSQDEEGVRNDEILGDFFAPFAGRDSRAWPDDIVSLIAINEGRLVDFLQTNEDRFPALADILRDVLLSDGYDRRSHESHRVTLVSLNARSVTAADEDGDTIFLRVLRRMSSTTLWDACSSCELAQRCYARHNAATFADPSAGPRVAARLQDLYRLTHYRGRAHTTLRDLRSAIAYTLTSGRDCTEIHQLYRAADTDAAKVLSGFYFSSWRGEQQTKDRLLGLLAEIDVAGVSNPQLDRQLAYRGPLRDHSLLHVTGRGDYDQQLLDHLFQHLPRGDGRTPRTVTAHRVYLAAARSRYYFECIDDRRSRDMLPFRSIGDYKDLFESANVEDTRSGLIKIINAINRGEGWYHGDSVGPSLVLQVRNVPGGTIRGYRAFPADAFELNRGAPSPSPYLETEPDHLVLRHDAGAIIAELRIALDLFELLYRRRLGYRTSDPDAADLGLRAFRHKLAAAPYQEVLLTVNGIDGHRIRRLRKKLIMTTIGLKHDAE